MYKEEIEIQDRVSKDYENIRYKKSYSIAYQNSWFEEMISLIERKGMVLDNGCGIGSSSFSFLFPVFSLMLHDLAQCPKKY